MIPDTPQLSVVMTTYNRGGMLHDAVRSVLAQDVASTPPFELIVVDNNSTDNTPQVVEQFARVDGRVRYIFEPRQGSSYGRNAGIREARAPLIAFTDDDVRAQPDWVEAIVRAFREHPEADVVGGRVLPIWPAAPPPWLTRDHWMPLALVDYGEAPVAITPDNPLCLVGANLSFRRPVFDVIGDFAPDFQLGEHGILGSVEDHEIQLRVLGTGRTVFYDPRVTVRAEIQPSRLDRAYHRRWHTGHGYFYALLRSEEMERTRMGTWFGVPAHLYRQAVQDLAGWARGTVGGDTDRAFQHEVRLRFFYGFLRTRRRQVLQQRHHERPAEASRVLPIPVHRGGPLTQPTDTRVAGGN